MAEKTSEVEQLRSVRWRISHFHDAYRSVDRMLSVALGSRLSTSEYFLLSHLDSLGGVSVSQGALVEHMGLEKGALSRMLQPLRTKGILQITVNSSDERRRDVTITDI